MLTIELRVLSGKQKGKSIPLKAGKFLIGRGEDCHLRPSNDLVSRHHCVFTVDDYGVRLRDLGSTNGTFINDEQLRGQAVLKQDDKVVIGSLEFEVVIKEAVESVAPSGETLETGAIIESDTGDGSNDLEESSQTIVDMVAPGLDEAAGVSDTHLGTMSDTQVTGAPPPPTAPPMPQQMPAPMQYAPGVYPPPGYPYPPQPYGQPGYPPQPYGQPGYPPQPPQYGGYPQQPMMPPGYPPQPAMPPQQMPGAPVPAEPIAEEPVPETSSNAEGGPEIKLPDPSETGAKEPEKKKDSSGGGSGDGAVDPRSAANAILRQMQQRRPKSE